MSHLSHIEKLNTESVRNTICPVFSCTPYCIHTLHKLSVTQCRHCPSSSDSDALKKNSSSWRLSKYITECQTDHEWVSPVGIEKNTVQFQPTRICPGTPDAQNTTGAHGQTCQSSVDFLSCPHRTYKCFSLSLPE